MIPRLVEPELLDSLPPDDPRAIHSRRDLRVINAWMGNARHLAAAIRNLPAAPRRVLELGTGDGTLMLKLARALQEPIELTLLDMQPVVSKETLHSLQNLGWQVSVVTTRLQDYMGASAESFDLILANLFLHHFQEEELRHLFVSLSTRCQSFLSCDPRRWRPALWTTRLLGLIGCNEVTRFDARVSVRAGFRDRELSRLWPMESDFELKEEPAGFASHLFLATARRWRRAA